MGLRDTISSAVGSAFAALGDIPEAVTYRRSVNTYDPQTSANSVVDTDITITPVFTSYEKFEVDRVMILATDVKAIVQQSDMDGTTPSPNTDTVIRNGVIFDVLRYGEDPSQSIYTLQLRARQ